ncbi:MAG: hypothetical protein NC548_64380 [Lachnospiraceae bacterium]|nr:hypothetical protein [Lachnospiraceae bacterium]
MMSTLGTSGIHCSGSRERIRERRAERKDFVAIALMGLEGGTKRFERIGNELRGFADRSEAEATEELQRSADTSDIAVSNADKVRAAEQNDTQTTEGGIVVECGEEAVIQKHLALHSRENLMIDYLR